VNTNVDNLNKQQETTEFGTWKYLNLARNSIYRLRELELAPFGLTVEQSIILSILINSGGASSSKVLEDLTLRQHHSISTLVNRMIKTKLVNKRSISESKKPEIFITEYGECKYKNVPVHCLRTVFSPLNAEDREKLNHDLNVLLKNARDLLGISFVPPFLLKSLDSVVTGNGDNREKPESRKLTDFELWMLLNRTRNSLYRVRELELAQFGLTVEQSAVLYVLINRGGSVSAGTIAEITMRQHHSVSTLVNRMTMMKLVNKRKTSESKKFEIVITEYGEELYRRIPVHSLEMLFANLNETEVKQLFIILKVLLEKARDLLGFSGNLPS